MLKKVLSLILSFMLVCLAASVSVFAAESQILSGLEAESLLYAPLIEEGGEGWLVDSLALPSTYQDSKITWSSSNRAVISEKGSVSRPAASDAEVTLTATTADGSKDFTFKVPAITTKVGTTPAITGTLIDDDFEDGTKSSRFVYNSPNFEADGGLNLWYNTNATIYPYEDSAKTLTGSFYTEMVITKPKTHAGWIGLYGPGGETIFALDYKNYNSDMKLFSYKGYVDESNTDWISPTTPNASEFEKIKIGMYFNCTDQTVSIWVNNREFLTNQKTRYAVDGNTAAIAGLSKFIVRSGSNIDSIKLEDFKLYAVEEAALSDAEIALADAEALTDSCLNFGGYLADNYIAQNIKLPITGICGSEITWSSNNDAYCDATGKITRSASSMCYPVTLTATINHGEASVQKSFDFKIAGENFEYVAYPTLKDNDEANYKTNLTFDEATANVKNKSNTQDGLIFDGKLSFYGGSGNGVRIWADDLGTFSGVVAIEAKVKREIGTSNCYVGVETNDGNVAYKAEWVGNGKFLSTYRPSPESSYVQEWTDSVSGEAKFVMFIDTKTERLSVWLNDKKIVDAYTFSPLGTVGRTIRNFYVYCDSIANKMAIDDVKMYYCIPATEHRYETDRAHIDEWTLPAPISSDLSTTAPYGSKVTWTSSDETIVDSNGVVALPADDVLHNVNLTANVTGIAEGEEIQKAFEAQVAGADYNAFPSLLANDEANYKTNLTFDEATSNVKAKGTAALTFDGALSFTGGSGNGAQIWSDNLAEFTGVLAFEATIKKSASQSVYIRIESSNGGYNIFSLEWLPSNKFASHYKATKDASASWNTAPIDAVTGEAKIIIFADSRTDRVAAWINGTKIADAYVAEGVESAGRKFRDILISCADSSTKITIDDVKMYYALPAVEHRLECDMADLANLSIPSETINNIELPSRLTYGSYLAWTSDNEAVLSSEGVATRGNEDVVANLTATPSANGQTGDAKNFAVTVKAFQAPSYTVAASEGSCKANYYVVQDASGYPTAKCYLVLYDGSKFVAVKKAEIADAANDGSAPAAELEFTSDEITAFGAAAPSAKAFVWKSGSIVPLSASVPVSVAN